ncbi:PaREP1 family protein [Acidianus hospitalis W1]|uniref:PaREP1 family protein n=1 Tax=Acidianus hospitalis (strain W1) TaxID=933801 RepID=F4B6Y2_ACIHW|nr:PaREP1 family protein [Acidianus hospitalis]AEE94675.1 PaREP1 family protein [Acidianus hospitalis W1]
MEITKLLDIKDRRTYASLRLLECLTEIRISLEMLKEGYSRNSAQKCFIAWKAFLSELASLNLD